MTSNLTEITVLVDGQRKFYIVFEGDVEVRTKHVTAKPATKP